MSLHQIRGHAGALEFIRRALRSQRLHHAYLFSGPAGVGKGMVARSFAMALLCEDASTEDGCGVCGACRRVIQEQYTDLHILQREEKKTGGLERSIKIHQVRELQRALSFKAYEGARRVVIIFEPESMTASTANALLKTLEEPGDNTHFILVSDAAHRLLPTVISRCQKVRFGPLDTEVVTELICEKGDVETSEAALIARLAEGSVGRGLNILGSDTMQNRESLIALLENGHTQAITPVLEQAETLSKVDVVEELPMIFHVLRTWFRDLLVLKVSGDRDRVVNVDRIESLRAMSEGLSMEVIHHRLHRINAASASILERMANTRLVLESLFVELIGRQTYGGAP